MAQYSHPDLPHQLRKRACLVLAFCWISGLLCGIFVFLSAGNSTVSWMRGAFEGTVSIVSLLGVTALPFLLSIFVVFLSKPFLILPICFFKAFLFSFVSLGIFQSYGSAGWLFRLLLLFSDYFSIPVLYMVWLQSFCANRSLCTWEIFSVFSQVLLIGSIDYRIISPILACLIDF